MQLPLAIIGGVLATGLSVYHVFAILFGSWGQLGVDLFVIIGIHFMLNKNNFRSEKIMCLIMQPVFYAIFWYLISTIGFHIDVNNADLIKQIFGAFSGSHWFITAYILLYIFHPTLNNIIDVISEVLLIRIAILLTIFVCIFKTIYTQAPVCDFLFFVNIYFIIGSCEKTKINEWMKCNSKRFFIFSIIGLITFNIIVLVIADAFDIESIRLHSIYLSHRGSIIILVIALLLFYSIDSTKHFSSKVINLLASTSLGVYLSHQGISQNVWKIIFINDELKGIAACAHMLFSVFSIFVCCALIDLIRQLIFDKMLIKLFNVKLIKRQLSKIDDYMNYKE